LPFFLCRALHLYKKQKVFVGFYILVFEGLRQPDSQAIQNAHENHRGHLALADVGARAKPSCKKLYLLVEIVKDNFKRQQRRIKYFIGFSFS